MSRDGLAALPRGATGLSAVYDCGISLSYSLTIFVAPPFALLDLSFSLALNCKGLLERSLLHYTILHILAITYLLNMALGYQSLLYYIPNVLFIGFMYGQSLCQI